MGKVQTAGQVINYATPAMRAASRTRRIAMLILAAFSLHVLALFILNPVLAVSPVLGGGVLGTPLGPITLPGEGEGILKAHIPYAIIALCAILLAQWLFLSPKGSWRIGLDTGKPLPLKSAIAAAFIGMLLSVGLLASIMELLDWWIEYTTTAGLATPQRFAAIWIIMGAIWGFWTLVLYIHTRSLDRYSALRTIVRRLVAGTVLELLLAGPAHAWIVYSRGGTCYCDRGTWTGVSFGVVTALWLFGPGALLVILRERKRRQNLIWLLRPPTPPPRMQIAATALPARTSITWC